MEVGSRTKLIHLLIITMKIVHSLILAFVATLTVDTMKLFGNGDGSLMIATSLGNNFLISFVVFSSSFSHACYCVGIHNLIRGNTILLDVVDLED